MDITFVSSLTSDDENRLAAALLAALGSLLDCLPIAYSIRVKTASGLTFERGHLPEPVFGDTAEVYDIPKM